MPGLLLAVYVQLNPVGISDASVLTRPTGHHHWCC